MSYNFEALVNYRADSFDDSGVSIYYVHTKSGNIDPYVGILKSSSVPSVLDP